MASVTYGLLKPLQVLVRRGFLLGRNVALHSRQCRQHWAMTILTSRFRCHSVLPRRKGALRGVEGVSGDSALDTRG